jgi:hypothetical protein
MTSAGNLKVQLKFQIFSGILISFSGTFYFLAEFLNFRLDILSLPGFDVHQNADNFLMDGGRDEQERVGRKPAVHGGVQG